jgi:hypothetical protein
VVTALWEVGRNFVKNWQFWLLFLGLAIGLGAINAQLGELQRQTNEIFSQTRWITWKMDQSGSERIKVDTE